MIEVVRVTKERIPTINNLFLIAHHIGMYRHVSGDKFSLEILNVESYLSPSDIEYVESAINPKLYDDIKMVVGDWHKSVDLETV